MKPLIFGCLLLLSCNNANTDTNVKDSNADSPITELPIGKITATPDAALLQDTLFDDGTVPSRWVDAGFSSPVLFKKFFVTFQVWVSNNNIDSIAAHISYPLKEIKNMSAFKSKYNQLFNSKVKNAVASQRINRIFRNSNGAMIGNGELWFNMINNQFFITAINSK